ncbi:hypothetical protein [Helicobacter sp. MIT 14-3879]|nr:hypothetical protein [Helicobacter sp. MIT 14-3879]
MIFVSAGELRKARTRFLRSKNTSSNSLSLLKHSKVSLRIYINIASKAR